MDTEHERPATAEASTSTRSEDLGRAGVGWAHSTAEAGESRWREGALVLGAFEEEENQEIGRNALPTPETVRNLQRKLYRKAKNEPEYRFYSLYDKVYRDDILAHALALVKANRGAPGVDGVSIFLVDKEALLAELKEELKTGSYRPLPVRRVNIPKPDGGLRPLGIPCVRDRVVQQAARLVLEPIFEADFPDNMYGYRLKRQAHHAIKHVHRLLIAGHTDVVDADLSKYFDTIPHRELLRSVARRVSDGKILKLIKLWLRAPIEARDEDGKPQLTGGKGHAKGTPQGGVISPLLANIYMRRFLLAWEQWGLPNKLHAHVVNYADDFVILCRHTAQVARRTAGKIVLGMELAINEEKTRVVHAQQTPFDFLGYTFGRFWSPQTGRSYLGVKPAAKRIKRFYGKVREHLSPWNTGSIPAVVLRLNQMLAGWAGYYSYGTLSKAYRTVDYLVIHRFRSWLCRRDKVAGLGTRQYPDRVIYADYGVGSLVQRLAERRRSCASGETSPRAGCVNCARPVR